MTVTCFFNFVWTPTSKDHHTDASYLLGIAHFVGGFTLILLVHQTLDKIEKIVKPNPTVRWDQTYSLLSLHLAYIILIGQIIFALSCFFDGMLYMLHLDSNEFKNLFIYELMIGFQIPTIILDLLCYYQASEWKTMYDLIQSQKDRTIEEITYDHNNENTKNVFSSMI